MPYVFVMGFMTAFAELLAQAGGGGNFGGSGRGGGGGGGDDGVGIIFYYLIRLAFEYPVIGVPLLIVAIIVFYAGGQSGNDYRVTRTIRRGRKIQEEQQYNDAVASVRQRDSAFTEELFLKRVANAFVTTQNAWSEQDLRPCRAFISDGVRDRFELYIAMQEAEGIRNRMKSVGVTNADIVSVTSDPHFDTIHVRITASAISYNESLKTGRRVSGNSDTTPIRFTEIWSFSRRPGVQTDPKASILDGRCPNCGSPVEIVDKAVCSACQSTVNSGQHDWVLSEITQDEEWVVPSTNTEVSGLATIQSRDKGLNLQHLEDRASVIFWRCMMAVYFRDPRRATAMLDSGLSDVPKMWNPGDDVFWKTPAVGSVEVQHAQPASEEDDHDRVMVQVRWSGTRSKGDRSKDAARGQQRIYTHVMTLRRHKDAQTHPDQTFSSGSCSGCGAPIDASSESSCGFCGRVLNDGRGDWVLEQVGPRRRYQTQPSAVAAGGPQSLADAPDLLVGLVKIIMADGRLDQKERDLITRFAQEHGVPKSMLKSVFETVMAEDDDHIEVPRNRQEARAFMEFLVRAALVDGSVCRSERRLLERAGAQVGWSKVDLKMTIGRVRKEMMSSAIDAIRRKKRSR